MKLLDIKNLRVYYFSEEGVVKAVDGVSLSLNKGETLGVVGESGCGKSTLGLSVLRLVPYPGKMVSGKIFYNGIDLLSLSDEEVRKLRGKEIAMIFQNPDVSLNPIMNIKEHLVEAILTHEEIDEREAVEKTEEILGKVGIPKNRINDYPHQFSGGMKQRIMIALALLLNPKLIIADEPTSSLDVLIQAKTLELLRNLKEEYGLSLILITHDFGVVFEESDRIAVMYAGHIIEIAKNTELYDKPLHPYTQALIKAVPTVTPEEQKLNYILGMPPSLLTPPKGCRFYARCKYAREICKFKEPKTATVGREHIVKCHLY
jgi:peptide/nickel transport system ATP-binding protein